MAVVFDENIPDITLYTAQTPNGIKISITLEELGLPYKVESLSFTTNDQKSPSFLSINPNGRIPALTDTFTDGSPIRLFESGSIMQYLITQYDPHHKISYPPNTRNHYEMTNWLFFQNAGLGPMQGQANHFHRYAPSKIEYATTRYQNETRRLYSVLEAQLAGSQSGYLVGDRCTVADIAHWGWVTSAGWAGVELGDYPRLEEWDRRMLARPAVERGRHVPSAHTVKELLKDKEGAEKHARESAKWVQGSMTSK